MPLLQCTGIKKWFGAVKALDDANFSVDPGEIRAIFGGNGSGKSTLAKILSGVVRKDKGIIKLNGQEVVINSPITSKRMGVIATAQELSLSNNLTVKKNVVLSILPTRYKILEDQKMIDRMARTALEMVKLDSFKDDFVADLSTNQKYMVEFAKALAQQPKILILDEVTSALFSSDFDIIKNIVFELARNGTTVLFISHRLSEIFSICNTVTILRNGVTVGTFDLKEIDKNSLLTMMGGSEHDGDAYAEFSEEEDAARPANIPVSESRVTVSFENLQLPSFGKTVKLEAREREFVGVSGLQGQGQSELIRTIFGLNGEVRGKLEEADFAIESPAAAVGLGFAFLSGDREREGTFSERSVRENIDVVVDVVLGRGQADYSKLIDNLNIALHNLGQPIKNLSGGNQQKVIISRWLAKRPKVLLADDPSKGVDVNARHDIHRIIKDMIDDGSVVIMASSDDEELVSICEMIPNSRVLIMYKGSIVKTLRDSEITVHNIVSSSISAGSGGGAV